MTKLELWAGAIKKHEGWKEGSISYRNNNPGNIIFGNLARSFGATTYWTHPKTKHQFAIFPTYEQGFQCLCKLLENAATGKSQIYSPEWTLLQFFTKYSPVRDIYGKVMPNYGYATDVAKTIGVTIDTKIKNLIEAPVSSNLPQGEVLNPKQLIYPIDKVFITQKFGENPQIYKRFGMDGHNGIDFRTRFWDSPLGHRYTLASKAGKVIEAKFDSGYGWMVRLEHDLDGNGNEQTVYGHHKKLYVKVGDRVKQGQTIALTNNTGFSTGSHLHFGWRKKGWKKIYNDGEKGYSDALYELLKT